MSVDHAPLPGWRSAETYRPLLRADPAVWAWEFGRRGIAPDVSDLTAPHPDGAIPDLCFASEGPAGDPVPVALWRWQADPTVPVLSLSPAPPGDPDALDLRGLDVAALVARTDDGAQHVVISDGARRLRLAIVEGEALDGPARCHFHLPGPSVGALTLDSLRLLIALRDTGRLPSGSGRAPTKAGRWLQIIRTHDARRQGASQRDIAVLLFGEARVREDWTGRSDYMRMRVQRLVRAAEQAVSGGYRALFGLRRTGLQQPRVIEVWRSPRWLGTLLPVLLCAVTFLGTSFSPPQSRHDLRQFSGTPCQKPVEPS